MMSWRLFKASIKGFKPMFKNTAVDVATVAAADAATTMAVPRVAVTVPPSSTLCLTISFSIYIFGGIPLFVMSLNNICS